MSPTSAFTGPYLLATALSKAPTLQLSFYDFGIILRRQCPDGTFTEYPVDASQLAEALAARTHFTTGLLPPDILYVAQVGLKRLVVGYRPPQRTALHVDGGEQVLRVPLPGLVLVRLTIGNTQPRYGVYAVKTRPTTLAARLYHAPLPNVYQNGSICWGSVPTPTVEQLAGTDLSPEWSLLLGSVFTSHGVHGKRRSTPEDIRQLYIALEGRHARSYPTKDLMSVAEVNTLGEVIDRTIGKELP